MKDLIELVRIVTKPKLRNVELIQDSRVSGSRLWEFYEGISNNQFQNEDEAAQQLHGVGKQAPVYQKSRKNLRDRLLNALFLIDLKQSSYADRQKAYYECCKEWAAVKILFGKNAFHAAIAIAKKILKISRKYEFTDLNVDLCRTLRLYYGSIDGNLAKFQYYQQELESFEQLWLLENRAEYHYIMLSNKFINSKTFNADFRSLALACFDELHPYRFSYTSYQFQFSLFLIEIATFTAINDYVSISRICDSAIAFFKGKEYNATLPLQVFFYQKAVAQVQLGNFAEANNTLNNSLFFPENGTLNWFKSHQLRFIVCMRQGHYSEARNVFEQVVQQPQFKHQPDHLQSFWRIFEGYLFFLSKIGVLEQGNNPDQKIRLSKLLNELRLFSDDKKGIYVHSLILEMILYIGNHQYENFTDRIEAIDKYRTRHLQDEMSKRCNHLLKMLLQIPKSSFCKLEFLPKVQFDYENLLIANAASTLQPLEMEIIPYEKIWSHVVEYLE